MQRVLPFRRRTPWGLLKGDSRTSHYALHVARASEQADRANLMNERLIVPPGNGKSLYDLSRVDLLRFPVITGFDVILIERDEARNSYEVELVNGERRRLAGIPDWRIEVHLQGPEVWVPGCPCNISGGRGTRERPYSGYMQGWVIQIFQEGEHVYILEGDGEGLGEDDGELTDYFKVPIDEYVCAWRVAMNVAIAENVQRSPSV